MPISERVDHTLVLGTTQVSKSRLAKMRVTQIFAVRLAVITLSWPFYVAFGFIGIVDGLVTRELRRHGGAIERSDVYHRAKRLLFPSILIWILVYLSIPESIHPSWIAVPLASAFCFFTWVATSSFKQRFWD